LQISLHLSEGSGLASARATGEQNARDMLLFNVVALLLVAQAVFGKL